MRRRPPEHLVSPGEVITAADLYARLERHTTQLNGAGYEADFNVQERTAEAQADPTLAARLRLEAACLSLEVNAHCLTYPNAWKDPVAAATYLQERWGQARNPLLHLRYGLLRLLTLPKGPHTHQLAQELVAQLRKELVRAGGSAGYDDDTTHALSKLALLLSKEYRCEPAAVRQEVLEWLLTRPHTLLLQWWQLQFFGEHPRLLSPAQCGALDALAERVYAHYLREDTPLVRYVCQAAIPLAARASNDARKWQRRLGDFWQAQAQARFAREPTSFIVQSMLHDALASYRAGNHKPEMAAIEALIAATKHQVRLQRVSRTYTLDGPAGRLLSALQQQLPAWVLAAEGAAMFWRLRYNLLPGRPSSDAAPVPAEMDLFGQVAFDRNRHLTTRHATEGLFGPRQRYGLLLSFYLSMTADIFAQGLLSGQLTYATMLAFLREQTWLGQVEWKQEEDEAPFTLVELVEPALRKYFEEMERAAQDAAYTPDLILCIDSLTLKIEALLRYYGRLLDPPLTTNRTGANGDQQEMTLEHLLDAVAATAGEDAIYPLRFALTKEGWNLRNNVAHGFLGPRDYTLGQVHLVMLALLVVATLNSQSA